MGTGKDAAARDRRRPEPAPVSGRRAEQNATAVFGLVLVVVGILVVADALRLPDTGTIGPGAVPLPVGALLALVGALLAVSAVRSRARGAEPRDTVDTGAVDADTAPAGTRPRASRERWWRCLLLAALLVAFAVLLQPLGYVLTSALLFAGAALLLGAASTWRALCYGWTLAAVVFLVFDRLIGLSLPTGPWGF